MHIKNAFLVIIVFFLKIELSSTEQLPIKVELLSPSSDEYPLYVSLNTKKLLFTTNGVYHIKQNESEYYLQTAYPEFSNEISLSSQSSDYLYLQTDIDSYLFTFPYLNKNIFFKTYKKSTNFNNFIQWEYTLVPNTRPDIQNTDNNKILISFVDYSTHKGVLIVLNHNKEIEIEALTPFNVPDMLFSCKHSSTFDTIFCVIASPSEQNLYYTTYNNETGFASLLFGGSLYNSTYFEAVKLASMNDTKYPAALVEKTTHQIYLSLFHVVASTKVELVFTREFDIYVENYLDFYLYPLGQRGLVVVGKKNGVFSCMFYIAEVGFEGLNLANKGLCAGADGYQFRLAVFDFHMMMTYRKQNENFVYIYEHTSAQCKEISLTVTSNEPIIFTRDDLADMNKFTGDDKSGIYIFTSKTNTLTNLGKFVEIDENGSIVSDVVYRNTTYFYKSIAFISKYAQREYYSYIIFFYVNENLIIPTTTSCYINFTITCYESCSSCDYVGNYSDHKCTECINGYFYKEYTQNCYSGQISNFYFDNSVNMYRPCKSNCISCDDGITCEQCDEGYELLSEYSNDSEDDDCVLKCENLFYITEDKKFFCLEKSEMCPPLYPCLNK